MFFYLRFSHFAPATASTGPSSKAKSLAFSVGPVFFSHHSYFDYNGAQREYQLYVPDDLQKKAPLVFLLHGSGGKAINFQGWLKMDAIDDSQGFIAVYPQGLRTGNGDTHWNAALSINQVDDVGFLSALAKHLQEKYDLDSDGTFGGGYSNGGFMGYELAAERPDIFKAVASLNGTMSGGTWEYRSNITPTPILQISGVLDQNIPIDGSLTTYGGWGCAWVKMVMSTPLNLCGSFLACIKN